MHLINSFLYSILCYLDPDRYMTIDDSIQKSFKFDLRTSLSVARRKSLLPDYYIFVTPNTRPTPSEMEGNKFDRLFEIVID